MVLGEVVWIAAFAGGSWGAVWLVGRRLFGVGGSWGPFSVSRGASCASGVGDAAAGAAAGAGEGRG